MAGAKTPTRVLTIYLLKTEVTEPQSAIAEQPAIPSIQITLSPGVIGTVFVGPSQSNPPRWLSLFENSLGSLASKLRNQSTKAVLIVKAGGRLFALTFGYGKSMLAAGTWEETFGLRVTLNSIEPSKIKSIDRLSFDAIARHTHEQAGQEGSIDQFGIDVQRDLLRAVVGTPTDPSLGKLLTGHDALSARVAIALSDLPALLERYIEKFHDESYKQNFAFIDHIREVGDSELKAQLDALLIQLIQTQETEKIWLAVPKIVDWEKIDGFVFGESKKAARFPDLHLSHFLSAYSDVSKLSIGTLKNRKITCFSAEGDFSMDKWTVYHCLYAEVQHDGSPHVLSGGKWYRIDKDYAKEVAQYISDMVSACDISFPAYGTPNDRSETQYNARVHTEDSSTYALMDHPSQHISYGGGNSKIEFCDLYSKSKQIIHVKRYGQASVLSHLFQQGLNSGMPFYLDSQFRSKVNTKLPASHVIGFPDKRPSQDEYEIIFAIISKSSKSVSGAAFLPFFSKASLRYAHQQLTGIGYRVSLGKIAWEEASEL